MADGEAPGQGLELRLVEHLGHEPHLLDGRHVAAVGDGDPRALLPAVLQGVEGEVGQARHVAVGRMDAEDAAHQAVASMAAGSVPS